MEKRLGPRLGLITPIVGTVSPNFSMLFANARTMQVWHPRGSHKMEVWTWVYVDKTAPPELKEAVRRTGVWSQRPAGNFEQDDMDNWQACTETCRGVVSCRFPLNMQMGLGNERFDEDLGAWANDFWISESNHRRFYQRWAQLMAANSWAEV